jgi:hypothetical protein
MTPKSARTAKEELHEEFAEDSLKVRGALREILSNNRSINTKLIDQMTQGDMSQIEEYTMIVKGILDASKLLTEMNSAAPKTVKEIDSIKNEKAKIDLDALMDSD